MAGRAVIDGESFKVALGQDYPKLDIAINNIISQGLARLIDSEYAANMIRCTGSPWRFESERIRELSPREVEVFILLGLGFSNARAGRVLEVTERTVKTHVGRILRKLELESRLQIGLAALVQLTEPANATPLLEAIQVPRSAGCAYSPAELTLTPCADSSAAS